MNAQIARFKQYLMYEKGLSPKSVEAYLHDVLLLEEFLGEKKMEDASFEDLQQFLKYLYQSDYNARSQARIISGMRAFYRYLIYANVLEYGGRMIGGDVSSVRINGFMHGFRGETDGYDPT